MTPKAISITPKLGEGAKVELTPAPCTKPEFSP